MTKPHISASVYASVRLLNTPTQINTHTQLERAARVDVIVPVLCCFFRCFYSKLDHAARLPCLPPAHTHTPSIFDVCTFSSVSWRQLMNIIPHLFPISTFFCIFAYSSPRLTLSPTFLLLILPFFSSSFNHTSIPPSLLLF